MTTYLTILGRFPNISWRLLRILQNIINRGDWLWSPANIKGANKDCKIYVGRSTTLHNLLFCADTLSMNYVTNTFLLVSSSVRSKQLLCFVQGQAQKTEQKHTTKKQEFHNHSLLLTIYVQKLSEGQTIVSEHWSKISDDCRRFRRKNRWCFDYTGTHLIMTMVIFSLLKIICYYHVWRYYVGVSR